MKQSIHSHEQKLDHLLQEIKNAGLAPKMESHLSRYVCILVSGYLEESLRQLLEQYANDKATPQIKNFVANEIKRTYSANPN